MKFETKQMRRNGLLIVSIFHNRKWVLGNFVHQIQSRLPFVQNQYVYSAFAKNKVSRHLPAIPIPRFEAYLFTYLTVFEKYLRSNPREYEGRSIVVYLHNEFEELGPIQHQLSVLSRSHSVYFMSSTDARIFIDEGLDESKVRLMYFAFDDDCLEASIEAKNPKSVLLASKYGSRKGLHILPSLVHSMPDWEFIATGRGWKSFMKKHKLGQLSNFKFIKFQKKRKLEIYSKARVFLSLSELEGGPVPLLETIAMNLIPIATDTGFAADLIENGKNGFIIPTNPTLEIIQNAMEKSMTLQSSTNDFVRELTWNRISKIVEKDFHGIKNRFNIDSRQAEI